MGERIAALAALNRVRAAAAEVPAPVPSPATAPTIAQAPAAQQAVNNITGARSLQEIAGLRQMAETTSQGITPNTNTQRADVVGSTLSRQAESMVAAPDATEPRQPAADVVAANQRNRLSFNRAILETLRGGLEAARENVPPVEQQMAAIREAFAARREEAAQAREDLERTRAENAAAANNREADALGLLAGAPNVLQTRPAQTSYPTPAPGPGGDRLNFLI